MLNYAIKRIGLAVLIIFLVMLAMYTMVFLVPGDPASLALGPRATPELKQALMERMGLDKPIYVQVWNFFHNALTGDLGFDVWSRRPVVDMIFEVYPAHAVSGWRGSECVPCPRHWPWLPGSGVEKFTG